MTIMKPAKSPNIGINRISMRIHSSWLCYFTWFVIVSWLFTAIVCTVGEYYSSADSSSENTEFTHHHGQGDSDHDPASQADECCAPAALSFVGTLKIPSPTLLFIVLPCILAVLATTPGFTLRRPRFAASPSAPYRHAFLINTIQPNAPPY